SQPDRTRNALRRLLEQGRGRRHAGRRRADRPASARDLCPGGRGVGAGRRRARMEATARAGGVAGIVLAAGASSRMGRPKMLLPLAGGTLLSTVAAALLDAGLPSVVVVLGCDADNVRAAAGLPEDPRLRVVVNDEWRS